MIKLHTRLSIAECRARLESAVDPERFAFSLSGYAGSKDFLGKIGDTGFRLQKRRNYHNSFAPFFYVHLTSGDTGTIIEGDFKMHPFVRPFMTFGFSFLAVFAVVALVLPSRGQPEAAGVRILMLLAAGVMAAFGFGLVRFGQWLGASEQATIIEFLKRTLETD